MEKSEVLELFAEAYEEIVAKVESLVRRMDPTVDAEDIVSRIWEHLEAGKWSEFQPHFGQRAPKLNMILWAAGVGFNFLRAGRARLRWDFIEPRSVNRMGSRPVVGSLVWSDPDSGTHFETDPLGFDPWRESDSQNEWTERKAFLWEILEKHGDLARLIAEYEEGDTQTVARKLGITPNALRIRISRAKDELRVLARPRVGELAA